jgi:hypothetical protein
MLPLAIFPLQADNPDYVLMRLDGILAELMVKVAPKLYRKFITTNAKGKSVLYVQLEKAIWNDEECFTFLSKTGRGFNLYWLYYQPL